MLAVPGSGFGLPGYFRLAYCVAPEVVDGALPVFREVGAKYFGVQALAPGGDAGAPRGATGRSVKYVVLIIDGASGWPVPAFGGRTSLEAAHTPNLDRLAREGLVGMAHTVPEGMEASSAVACMSVLGFDPTRYYAGRGPIEAMAMGIDLEPGQVAMRCNLVNVSDGIMTSYSAGNISSAEAAELVAALQAELGDERLEFHSGVGFRHILTVRDGTDLLATTFAAPHDITDREVAGRGPVGPGAGLAESLMERSKAILAEHPVNQARIARGRLPATQIWLFWPGMRPGEMPTFAQAYGGRRAALTSAVDLLRGLALQTGMDFLTIPGVTDGNDNDFAGQMAGRPAGSGRPRRGVRARRSAGRGVARRRRLGKSAGNRAGGRLDGAAGDRPRGRGRRGHEPAGAARPSHPARDQDPCGRTGALRHVGPGVRDQRG